MNISERHKVSRTLHAASCYYVLRRWRRCVSLSSERYFLLRARTRAFHLFAFMRGGYPPRVCFQTLKAQGLEERFMSLETLSSSADQPPAAQRALMIEASTWHSSLHPLYFCCLAPSACVGFLLYNCILWGLGFGV